MASTEYDLKLKITADNQASSELDKVSKSTENLQKKSFQWSKSTESALKKVGATATVVAGSMIALWKSFVDNAVKIEPVENSFKSLADAVGESSDAMMKSLRTASKWAVKDYDLMLSANRSMKLWVATNTKDMTDLMKIARLYGQQMWQDVTSSFNDIVTWLWRWSPMILDNLGIIIDSEKAYKDYAEQLWKTAWELSKAEKTQALVNATLVEWRKALEEFWEPPATMQERMEALYNTFDRIQTTIWKALIPVIEKVMEVITPIIEKVSAWIEKNPELTATIMTVVTAVAWLTAVVSWLALALPAIWTAITVLSWPIWWIIGAIALVATAWANNWWWIQEKTKEAVENIERIIWPRLDKIKAWWNEHWETVMIYVEEVMWAIAETIWTTLSWIAVFIAWTFEWIDASIKLFKALWNWDWEEVSNIAVSRATNMDQLLTDSFWDTRTSIKTWIQDVYDWIVDKLNAIVSSVKNIVGQIKDARNGAKSAVSNFWNNITNWAKNARNNVTWMFKANGWPVSAWSPYIVWERWPELFVPSSNWNIIPNEEITKNNNVTINMSGITIREDADIQKLANEIVRMTKLEKNYWII